MFWAGTIITHGAYCRDWWAVNFDDCIGLWITVQSGIVQKQVFPAQCHFALTLLKLSVGSGVFGPLSLLASLPKLTLLRSVKTLGQSHLLYHS